MKQEIRSCFLHRYALVSKTLPLQLKKVLDISVKTINWIRGRALNHHIFRSLCEDLGSEHSVLLFHSEARWLSRGRVLTRFLDLRKEIKVFLEESHFNLLEELHSREFTQNLAYLLE
ncbi:hypothetical protein FHG87_004991 [Trinorchestia longiramus]|nr:hypothetical protein FHG87_004991 [Trinorchestia longiramus]